MRVIFKTEGDVISSQTLYSWRLIALGRVLPVQQETNVWCWAACGQSVLHYFGRHVSQSDFCRAALGGVYYLTANPYEVAVGFYNCGVDARAASYSLDFDSIKWEIYTRRRPMVLCWIRKYKPGHMMVIDGYAMLSTGENLVSVMNPELGYSYLTGYDYLRGGYEYDHFWAETVYDFR